MNWLKKALFSILLGVFCVISTAASARECTCKDLPTIRRRAQRAATAQEAWKLIFGWASGLSNSATPPASNKELNVRLAELMGSPRSSWNGIMSQPVAAEAAEPPKIGGLNAKGEPVIDENFQNQNCDGIVQAVILHEQTHKNFFLGYSFWHVMTAFTMSSRHLQLRAESEVVAYGAEKEFLKSQAEKLEKEKKCKKGFRASGNIGDMKYSGLICSFETPFTIDGDIQGYPMKYKFNFKPSSASEGTVTMSGAGHLITAEGGYSYSVEGLDTDHPRIKMAGGSTTGHSPVGSVTRGGGSEFLELVPLDNDECAEHPPN